MEAYQCLLFDLWCNHTDCRQTLYQDCGSGYLQRYFIDHDRLFSTEERDSLQRRTAQTRHLNLRLYNEPVESLEPMLFAFAGKIENLVSNELDSVVAGVPGHWGTAGHRQSVLGAPKRRSSLLSAYIHEILRFAATQAQESGLVRFDLAPHRCVGA
jgi:hypothetical protein